MGLSTFCIIIPTFFRTSISPEFTWIFVDWVSAGFFSGVFSPLSEKKRLQEKSQQKMLPESVKNIRPYSLSREDANFETQKAPSENPMIRINSCLWQIFLGCFFWFDTWLSFLLWWYLYLKFWIKLLVSRRSILRKFHIVYFVYHSLC